MIHVTQQAYVVAHHATHNVCVRERKRWVGWEIERTMAASSIRLFSSAFFRLSSKLSRCNSAWLYRRLQASSITLLSFRPSTHACTVASSCSFSCFFFCSLCMCVWVSGGKLKESHQKTNKTFLFVHVGCLSYWKCSTVSFWLDLPQLWMKPIQWDCVKPHTHTHTHSIPRLGNRWWQRDDCEDHCYI